MLLPLLLGSRQFPVFDPKKEAPFCKGRRRRKPEASGEPGAERDRRLSVLRCHRRNLDFVERTVLNRANLLEANQLEQREKSYHDLDTGDHFAKQI